jgi:hypothetical protein
VHRRDLDIPI